MLLFHFGPDKTPFSLTNSGEVATGLTTPFHGIISRGLLERLTREQITEDLWHNGASHLDYASAGDEPALMRLRALALECEVLSFGQSALAARQYVHAYCHAANHGVTRGELWNLKEGHSSSVWGVTLYSGRSRATSFILNVARDRAAGLELFATSEFLRALAGRNPRLPVARVEDIAVLEIPYGERTTDVVVTRNEWIEGAHEVHQVRDRETGEGRLVLVERFVTAEGSPSRIKAVRGRIFTDAENVQIRTAIDAVLRDAAPHGSFCIDINDGDVVWNGTDAIVVAIGQKAA